jgi:CSLREA domain-containing protein
MSYPSLIRLFLPLLAVNVGPAMAATITVNSLGDSAADDGNCTLREAIIAASANFPSGGDPGECSGGDPDPAIDRIEFQGGLTGSITLGGPLPLIGDPLEIIGPGAQDLTIDAGGQANNAAVVRVLSPTTIESLRIANANSTGSGGAINANQPLLLRGVAIENNQAREGGGVFTTNDLRVEGCVFRDNSATQFTGGAIRFADAGNTLIVLQSLFENNRSTTSARSGGAIDVGGSDHVTEIADSTFVNNRTEGGNWEGGAIRIGGQRLFLTNSTFVDNAATGSGGAISLRAVEPVLANITVSGNIADSNDDGVGDAGGIWSPNSTAAVGTSLIAGNEDLGGDAPDCQGSIDSDGYNLIGVGSGCSGISDGVNGDQVGTATTPIDPLLAVLSDNGGPTPTRALLPGSPAVDAGNPAGCTSASGDPLSADQRGVARPEDGDGDDIARCDIGAFELISEGIFSDRFEN